MSAEDTENEWKLLFAAIASSNLTDSTKIDLYRASGRLLDHESLLAEFIGAITRDEVDDFCASALMPYVSNLSLFFEQPYSRPQIAKHLLQRGVLSPRDLGALVEPDELRVWMRIFPPVYYPFLLEKEQPRSTPMSTVRYVPRPF